MQHMMFTYCKHAYFRRAAKLFQNKLEKLVCRVISHRFCSRNQKLVLGIETSCDDTGAAVIDSDKRVCGDALHSQTKVHFDYGGIVPPKAQALHKENIENVVKNALGRANVSLQDLDAIAVTVKPGLALSLGVGVEYAKSLVRESGKPMIPIHHMEAHALTIRLLQNVELPYLVYLMSGGHCLLAVARGIEDFLLLGSTIDLAPGVCIDKVARALCLKNLPQCEGLSGGAAIELMAVDGDPLSFSIPHLMSHYRDCDFSFTGLITYFERVVMTEMDRLGVPEDQVLPNASDVCASFQYAVIRSLCRKLQRAFIYCDVKELLPEKNKVLVASGGVASNMYFRRGLTQVCDDFSCQLICPPPHLCTDNGIMIAWNGMEKLLGGVGIADDPMAVRYEPKYPFGTDIREDVRTLHLKLPRLKLQT